MSPLVSVIVPTYNRAALLVEAVESVMQQTFANWELLVVDDGSSDDTEAVMGKFRQDQRIRYFKQENRGQSSARNLGLNHSRGSLVAFLDSDNRWLPHKLASQVAFMEQHSDVDVLYGETQWIGADGSARSNPDDDTRYSGIIWRQLLDKNCVNFNTSLVRRSGLDAIGGFNEDLRGGEDYDLWLRLSSSARFHFLPGVVTEYRVEGDRVTNSSLRVLEANLASVKHFFKVNRDLATWDIRRRVMARLYWRFARCKAAAGESPAAIALGVRSTMLDPLSVKAWRSLAAAALSPLRKWLS